MKTNCQRICQQRKSFATIRMQSLIDKYWRQMRTNQKSQIRLSLMNQSWLPMLFQRISISTYWISIEKRRRTWRIFASKYKNTKSKFYFIKICQNERSLDLNIMYYLMNLIHILILRCDRKFFCIYEQNLRWTRQRTLWKSNRISFVCASILQNRLFILKYFRIKWNQKSIYMKI